MELIIFDSRRYAKEVIYLYTHFYKFLFTQTLQRGVAPLSYNKGSCDGKTSEVLGSFLSSCWVAFGRPFYLWAVLLGVPRYWRVPPASGGHPPRLLPPSGGWVYCLEPEAPPKGECRRGRRYFWLALPDACGLRPCNWTHLKNGLVPYSCVAWTYDK